MSFLDETRSVSKTHLEFGVEGGELWVRDLHSTNGVVLVDGDVSVRLEPGQRVVAPVGSRVRAGEREFTVVRG
ncbi:hypothetical protein D3C81_2164340 [compost metagenome]